MACANVAKLECAEIEKDLGVIVHQNLSGSSPCAAAVKKANRMLGYIARSIEYHSLYMIHFSDHTWSTVCSSGDHYKKDIEVLERVQRRCDQADSKHKG